MEDILELYRMSYDPNIPIICMDEQPYQFLGEKFTPIPWKRGRVPKRMMSRFVKEPAVSLCSPNRFVGGGMFTRWNGEPSGMGRWGYRNCLTCNIRRLPKYGWSWTT
jgi:hypothetical protein